MSKESPIRLRLLMGLLLAILLHAHAHAAAPDATPGDEKTIRPVTIRVIEGGWGNSDVRDIQRALDSVAAVFVPHAQDQRKIAIRVAHRFGNPMVSYRRGAADEYIVYLTARDDRWYQFAYQFAHEFCHILSNFDRKGRNGEIVRDNQWFEEAVCESASLFSLQQLASLWDAAPPDARWAGYGHNFREYRERLLAEPHRQLSANQSLVQWFGEHGASLHGDPYQRAKNELVAKALLPLFEQNPRNWAALGFLNAKHPGVETRFADYLLAWQAACPEDLKPFVGKVVEIFGLNPNSQLSARP